MKKLDQYEGWAVVTGASAGIGMEFARAIAAHGVSQILVARRKERLEELAQALEKEHGIQCRCVAQDLAADRAVEHVVTAVGDTPVGILVNNAGFGYGGHFETRDAERLANMVALNCSAPVLLSRAFLPQMLARKRGAIIMVSSVLGLVPGPFDAVYAATKAFDLSLGESLWAELRGTGVDVVTVCPGATETEFFAVEGFGEQDRKRIHGHADRPETIARLALGALGRKPTVLPWFSALQAIPFRFLSRKRTAQMLRRIMTKSMGFNRLG